MATPAASWRPHAGTANLDDEPRPEVSFELQRWSVTKKTVQPFKSLGFEGHYHRPGLRHIAIPFTWIAASKLDAAWVKGRASLRGDPEVLDKPQPSHQIRAKRKGRWDLNPTSRARQSMEEAPR